FIWPNSKISVMGGEQAKSVLELIGSKKAEMLNEQFEQESSAWYSTSRLWDDAIIDPAHTRTVLALAISSTLNRKFSNSAFGIFRM
ncbi:MAG: methylcrotonoyl-CoA carboxylase, partial [Prolixibacteraceae bacterium]|nr:methylcrotonoyl-CoA carboxylase [Prolixibacteraceae bacterium]